MPTKICLNCEEKLVSFQLFILECYKVQENLKKIYEDSCNSCATDSKMENTKFNEFGVPIKSEVNFFRIVINNMIDIFNLKLSYCKVMAPFFLFHRFHF